MDIAHWVFLPPPTHFFGSKLLGKSAIFLIIRLLQTNSPLSIFPFAHRQRG